MRLPSEAAIRDVMLSVPDELLMDSAEGESDFTSPDEARARYQWYLTERLSAHDVWIGEAIRAQEQLRLEPPQHLKARR